MLKELLQRGIEMYTDFSRSRASSNIISFYTDGFVLHRQLVRLVYHHNQYRNLHRIVTVVSLSKFIFTSSGSYVRKNYKKHQVFFFQKNRERLGLPRVKEKIYKKIDLSVGDKYHQSF